MRWNFEYKFEFKNIDRKLWIKIKEYLFKYVDDNDYDNIEAYITARWQRIHSGGFMGGKIMSKDDKIIKYNEKIIPSDLSEKLSNLEPIVLYYTVDIENKIVTFTDIEPKELLYEQIPLLFKQLLCSRKNLYDLDEVKKKLEREFHLRITNDEKLAIEEV